MVGYSDLSHPELSLLVTMDSHSDEIFVSHEKGGAAGLMQRLKKCDIKGGGALISERALTHIESTCTLTGVLQPYLHGGNGTKKALLFVIEVVHIICGRKPVCKLSEVLLHLKARLEMRGRDGLTSVSRRLRDVAMHCEALSGFKACAEIMGQTKWSGGMLEVTGCDGIWPLFRPLVVGCEKPRLPEWKPDASGGNPMTYYPCWDLDSKEEKCIIYRLGDCVEDLYKYQQGQLTNPPCMRSYEA